MSVVGKFAAIYKTDWKMLRRDPILVYSVVMSLVLLGIVRVLKERLSSQLYFGPALFVLLMIPMIFGMVPGFMIVNEKEEKTIHALQVVPISSTAFLAYRLLWSSIITVVLTLVAPRILDISLSSKVLGMLILLFVLEAIIFALLVIDFSETRMQAMAVMKIVGWILLLPIVIKFVVVARNLSTDWSKFTALLPTYWIYKIYEEIQPGGNLMSNFQVGFAVHLVWLLVLVLLFRRRIL